MSKAGAELSRFMMKSYKGKKIADLHQEDLRDMLQKVQYALDGLWKDEHEIMADTGMSEDAAAKVLPRIDDFLSLDLR